MKATTRPFKAKHAGARCPVCQYRIAEGQSIVKLEKPVTWIEEKINQYGKSYLTRCTAQYVHAICLEERNDDD